MELTAYETGHLLTILEDLIWSTESTENGGANIVDKKVWLTPNQCYMLKEIAKKCRTYLYK